MSMMDFAAPAVETDSTSISNARRNANKTSNDFDLNDFYYLFSVQLQNQDMMNPVDDSQFLAQMTQMAMIKAMDQMNEMTMTSYAFEFMGKDVIVAYENKEGELETVEGAVERVTLYNGTPKVTVEGVEYDLSQVMEVITPEKGDALELIGREVAYGEYDKDGNFLKDDKGNIIITTGIVEKVTTYDGKTLFYIDGKAYSREQILEVMGLVEKDKEITIIWPDDDEQENDKIEDTDKTDNDKNEDNTDKTEGNPSIGENTGGDTENSTEGSTDNNAGGGSVNPPVEDTTTGNEGEAGSAETTTPAA